MSKKKTKETKSANEENTDLKVAGSQSQTICELDGEDLTCRTIKITPKISEINEQPKLNGKN